MVRAVCWLMTSSTCDGSSHSVMPSAFETLRMRRGFTRMPSLGKTEYDATCSSSVISTAPRAMGRYAGMLVVTPNLWAVSMTL